MNAKRHTGAVASGQGDPPLTRNPRKEGVTVNRAGGRKEGVTVNRPNGQKEGVTVNRSDGRSVGRPTTSSRFFALDRRRDQAGIPIDRLLAAARVSRKTWWRLGQGDPKVRPSTIEKLDLALRQLAPAGAVAPEAIASLLRALMVILARETGSDPALVLAQDFTVQRPHNPIWLQAARLRRMAIYVACVDIGLERVAVGRAIDCTRQNIKQALDQITLSEDPQLEELLARVGALVAGARA